MTTHADVNAAHKAATERATKAAGGKLFAEVRGALQSMRTGSGKGTPLAERKAKLDAFATR